MYASLRSAVRLIVVTAVFLGVAAAPAAAADAPFTSRFAATAPGDIAAVGNVLMTCPTAATNCAAARAGTATGAALNNNAYDMVRYKLAEDTADASILDSSKATVTLPAGATVLWAGLYWSADTSAGTNGVAAQNATGMGTVKFAVPHGSYTTETAAAADVLTSSLQPSRYRAFKDVTSLVRTAGGGEYKVANVQAGTGQDRYAGWSLMVAYRDAAQPVRRMSVYDGLGTVDNATDFSTTIQPFHTPASGLVKSRIGLLSFEGDAGYSPETAQFNGHALSDSLNPSNNAMNSTIETGGVPFTAKVPDQRNQLNVDLDTFVDDAGIYLSNEQSSASLTFTSSYEYFMPSALFLVSDEGPATNTVLPSIGGTATDGRTLTAAAGTWNGTPSITYGYQWQRCDATGANCADIAGATGSTYTLTNADVGKRVDVVVKATNDAGTSDPATSAKTAAINPALPANTVIPTVAGQLTDGRTLTADKGTWTGTPTVTYGYQWQRCDTNGANCVDIAGATNTTYTLTSPDVTSKLRVAVKGTNAAGTSAAAYSAPTAGVAGNPAANTAVPMITGTARDGQTLTAANGTWTGSTPMTFAYQWQRCETNGANCVDIAGATASTYALTPSDVGAKVRVAVKGTNTAGTSTAISSAVTAVVAALPAANTVAPTVSGTLTDGQTLTANKGTWTGTAPIAYTYQWQRCDSTGANCADIPGATNSTFALTGDDVTLKIRVSVTGTNAAGSSTPVSSTVSVTTVAGVPVANSVAPTMTGAAQDGQTLTAGVGTWTGTQPITLAYQWQRCDAAGANCVAVTGATNGTYVLTPDDVGKRVRVAVTATNVVNTVTVTTSPTTTVVIAPPANVVRPTISGAAYEGGVLTAASRGTWTGTAPLSYATQWQRCDAAGANCADVAGATGSTYTLTAGDPGSTFRTKVTATNAAPQNAVATSVPSSVATIAPPVNVVVPIVSGTPAIGATLTAATRGTWTGGQPMTFAYQWLRCDANGANCVDIAGATALTYTMTTADAGAKMRVRVTATNTAGSAQAASVPSDTVATPAATTSGPTPPVNLVIPSVPSTLTPGAPLDAGDGSWGGSPANRTYQWQRCDENGANCVAIPGATGATYTPRAADAGKTLRVAVTATNAAGSATALSGIVAAGDLSAVAGVLVSDTSCQQLAGGAKFSRVKVKGIGNVRVRAYTSGPALNASPVQLTTQITGGTARGVAYRLDGRALAAKTDRMHRSTITPAQLRRVGTHTIVTTVRGAAGKAKPIKLTVKTVPCQTLFTAQRWNTTAGTGLRLRVDARSALSTVAFKAPGALLPRPLKKARPIGFIRLYVAGRAKPVRTALTLPARGKGGVLLNGAGWPKVVRTASGISVTGLPAGTAVAELTLYRVRKLDRPTSTRRYAMSAQIRRAGVARQVLRQKPAAPKH